MSPVNLPLLEEAIARKPKTSRKPGPVLTDRLVVIT